MKCIIQTFLESDINRLRKSDINVLVRFIRKKYKIDMSKSALQQKINNIIKPEPTLNHLTFNLSNKS